ncbi:hypothetical protein [Marinimicrobium locisalis]|uniref:hypothetical protein n=1 Tax=Marinimicrobium locisalis TaxID=546022 RepID=UPI003221DB78
MSSYRLMFTGDIVTGFQRQEVIDNLASLLKQSPEEVRETLFPGEPVEFKTVESKSDADHWRRQFAEAGALLIILPGDEDTPGGSRYAGADPAGTNIEEPSPSSVTARLDAVRRRNVAFMKLGGVALLVALVIIVVAWLLP